MPTTLPSTLPAPPAPAVRGWLPRTLFARVTLVIVAGLAAAQLLAFAALRHERGQALRELMMTGIELDIASSVAILNRLPAGERAAWLDRLERPNYRFLLGGTVAGAAPEAPVLRGFADTIARALRPFAVTAIAEVPAARDTVLLGVRLDDGSSLAVRARRVPMPVSDWVLWAMALQGIILGLCVWMAVRQATRPLAALADAADRLGPDLNGGELAEDGPAEVARAARAFNAMQRRIAGHMAERVQILAAISHDLQTPITRMRLRADLMDDETVRAKLSQDLDAMQTLVREGLAYARTLHGDGEAARRLDLDALLDSLVSDYRDTGQPVSLHGAAGTPLVTRPHALRRILTNLVDNAIKYGGAAELRVDAAPGTLTLTVTDRGPGIPHDELDAVLKPFYRLEASRNRDTGGTGLGLAIAHQLATAIGASLSLHHRDGGGLEARVVLPLA